ncbi:MAG: UpxY family transcription antiterminator [Salinivirgaceae bacterium]|nr:UpxY family transcription antiterminator [Salinivirgaceae bacterium]
MANWYVLKTKPRQEKAVRTVLQTMGVEYFLPTITEYHYYGHGRKKKIEVLVLPSMVFVHVEAENRFTIVNVMKYDVHYLVDRNSNSSMVVSDKQMNDFMAVCSASDVKLESVDFAVGDKVTIHDGQFDGLQGVVSRINGKKRFVIVLDGLANIAVDLPGGQLEGLIN